LPRSEAVRHFSARITHRLTTHLLIPGLINTHSHAAMTLFRGFADDLHLEKWLNDKIWPAEKAHVSKTFVADGTRLAIDFFPEVVAKVVEESGIRATLGLILLEFPTAYAQDADEYLKKGREVHDAYHDHPLIKTALAPHAPYSVYRQRN